MSVSHVADTFWGKILVSPQTTPDSPQSLRAASELLVRGDYPQAADGFREAIDQSEPNGSMRAEALLGNGTAELLCGRAQAAIDSLKKAVTLSPQTPTGFVNLGVALIRDRQNEEAIEWLRKASRLAPCLAEIYYNLGLAYEGLRNPDAAIDAYNQAAHYDPQMAAAFNNLGILYLLKPDYVSSIGAFRRSLSIRPDCVNAKKGLYLATLEQETAEGTSLRDEQERPSGIRRLWRSVCGWRFRLRRSAFVRGAPVSSKVM